MFGDVPLVLVEDERALQDAAQAMHEQRIIALDIEADSFHHYREKVCLLQFSIPGRDYIVDPLAVPDLSPLGPILADRDRIKVLHGADYDVVSMKRDYGFICRNIFDTMIAARFLNSSHLGLADLLLNNFDVEIDKQYQRHNWARRPLLPEHLDYARGDTHWLLALRELMIYRLERVGWLEAVLEEGRRLEQREWAGRGSHPGDFLRVKGATALDERGKHVLRALYEYRDGCARQMDRPVFKVIPDPVLVAVSRRRPQSVEELVGIVRRRSALMRQHGEGLLRAVATGLADERELPEPPPGRRRRSGLGSGPSLLLERMRTWRNLKAKRVSLPPSLVASNGLLKEIGRHLPKSSEELRAIDELRDWQVDAFGEEILEIVRNAVAERPAPGSGRRRSRRRRRRKNG